MSSNLHAQSGRVRTLDDFFRLAHPQTAQQSRELRDLRQLTYKHPELIPQLIDLVYSRLATNDRAASVQEAFERLRWDTRIRMSNSLAPLLTRLLVYLRPDLSGQLQAHPIPWDDALGMRIAGKKLPGDYARRLEWSDGRALTEETTQKKPAQSVEPAQSELFTESK